MALDPALVGYWTTTDGVVRFTDDGWSHACGVSPCVVSPDGATMTDGGTLYGRLYGAGPTLVGVWIMRTVDDGISWVEERNYRADGTYTVTWTADGQFDSVLYGSFEHSGAALSIEERRAIVSTDGLGTIFYDPPYAPDWSATYAFNGDGSFTMTIDGVDHLFTPTTP